MDETVQAERTFDPAPFFLVAVAAFLVTLVLGQVGGVTIAGETIVVSYKTLGRAIALLWIVSLALPFVRTRLGFTAIPADLPLTLFALTAAISVVAGGGRWGDVRNLCAAIALGWLARGLFATPARRPLFLHYLGGIALLILTRELAAHPNLLPPRELGRYDLLTANPNPLGFLFAMVAPLALAETLAARGARRTLAALYAAACILGTLITFSRTAAVGLTVGVAIVAWQVRPRGMALAVGALGVLGFVAVQRPDLWHTSRAPGDLDRLRIMHTSLTLAAESPVLGVGYGINNLERVFPARYAELYGAPLFRFHSANQLVDLLIGTGITGTALALWWVTRLWRAAAERLRTAPLGPERARAAGSVAALVAIVLMSLAEPPLYHGKLVPVLFLVLAYVQLGTARTDRAAVPTGSAPRAGAEVNQP